MIRRALFGALLALGCSQARPLDAQTRGCAASTPAPGGVAEVGFALDTGGDQGHFPRVQSGLFVFVHEGARLQTRTFASCDSADVHWTDGEAMRVEAFCDGRDFELTRAGGEVVVRQKGKALFSVPITSAKVKVESAEVLPCAPAR